VRTNVDLDENLVEEAFRYADVESPQELIVLAHV
jgi:Arc/MetJ family transcription regulator